MCFQILLRLRVEFFRSLFKGLIESFGSELAFFYKCGTLLLASSPFT